jgi:hypothetical protein
LNAMGMWRWTNEFNQERRKARLQRGIQAEVISGKRQETEKGRKTGEAEQKWSSGDLGGRWNLKNRSSGKINDEMETKGKSSMGL